MTNNGNVTISDIKVNDLAVAVGNVTCDATTLAPSAATDCTSDTPYTVVQADVDAGSILNTATAAGTDPAGKDVKSLPATEVVPASGHVTGIELIKVGRVNDTEGNGHIDGLADAGETITYRFLVYNSGNVTLDNVGVTDGLLGAVTCQAEVLAPQAHTTCTAADYTVTQADVDTGNVTNHRHRCGHPTSRVAHRSRTPRPRSSRPPPRTPASYWRNRAYSTTPPARPRGSARSGSRSPTSSPSPTTAM